MKNLYLILMIFLGFSVFSQGLSQDEVYLFDEIKYVPVYPSCKGNSKFLKKCFREKVEVFFRENLDLIKLSKFGFRDGKCKINVQFIVEKNGKVKDVIAITQDFRLKTEVEKIFKSLPKMKPAKEGGQKVPVKCDFSVNLELPKLK